MQDVYAKIYLQPSLEILVAKFSHELIACLGTAAIDGWQRHAVEGVGLDHGVEGHVVKNERIADGEWFVEGIISNDVALPGRLVHQGDRCERIRLARRHFPAVGDKAFR